MSPEETLKSYSKDFQSYSDIAKELIDSELRTLLPAMAELKLQKQIEYALQTKGKRLRPTLVLLSGESVGGKRKDLRNLALAIELLHLASLVHDDILDEDLFRRNTFSVYAKWSVKDAILVGDLLASLSLSLCKGYKREILNAMIDTCMQLSDGEYSDIKLNGAELKEKAYIEKIGKKCASLFSAACECGALAANGSPGEIKALKLYGKNYGLAYQIRDDISDAQISASDLQPVANKFRATLPIIHAYESATSEKRARLRRLLSEKTQDNLRAFLDETRVYFENGSLSYCANKVNDYVERAVASLAQLKDGIFKNHLIEMAEFLRVRDLRIDPEKVICET